MEYKIVSDSSSNVLEFADIAFASVPLKICTREKEYVDDAHLNVEQMVEEIRAQGGRSGSSCPNVQEWLEAFEGAEGVFALTITSNLSGAYNSAVQAAKEYCALHPEAKVCVLDTLSTGPEMLLIMEELRRMILEGMEFEAIEAEIRAYMRHTHLFFALKSLVNLARNGRVNPATATIAGALGICVVGRASDEGTLEQMHKCRGEQKLLRRILQSMEEAGYRGGRVRIDHCMNPEIAAQLAQMLRQKYPESDVRIGKCGALCSFYAEKGGFLIGFEDGI